ncbi:MAG: endonuclease III [Clostridia bacterium]|nr:endonuclease III [Clostridia bacterium]
MEKIKEYFNKLFENPVCELNFKNNFELLISVILSAQCTDKRVNKTTKNLFKKYKTPQDFAKLKQEDLEKEIFSCGFYKNKAKNIVKASQSIVSDFGGTVPSGYDNLIKLAGVGRKTANVMLSVGFGDDAIAVDTHVLRVSNRLGLAKTKDPTKCEISLQKNFEKKDWSKLHYQMVLFGRYYCKARNPKCEECELKNQCNYYKERKKLCL